MFNINKRFSWRQIDQYDGTIIDNEIENEVCSIKNIFLVNARLIPKGEIIIGDEVPMPLFWWQYANHEDPDRNAGILKNIEINEKETKILINILSTNKSESILSKYSIEIFYSGKIQSYIYRISANLKIKRDSKWLITYNSAHGEIEYCNFYPNLVFVKDKIKSNKYTCCVYEDINNRTICLPHYHLELNEYRSLKLKENGKYFYFLENENPVIQILEDTNIKTRAGICSYMWDVHFGYRVCDNEQNVLLGDTEEFNAKFQIYSISREEGQKILDLAIKPEFKEIANIPIYIDGLNTFSNCFFDFPESSNLWPWETEIEINPGFDNKKQIEFRLENKMGYSDNYSLHIQSLTKNYSRWIYTALGSEFGKEIFKLNKKFNLNAEVKFETQQEDAFVRIGIRIHYKDEKGLFDVETYEYYYSENISRRSHFDKNGWIDCTLETPIISKLPDRVHLLLELHGIGLCWFDDVFFKTI